jgi:hypothetical protein
MCSLRGMNGILIYHLKEIQSSKSRSKLYNECQAASGAQDQIFVTVRRLRVGSALSDERTDLSFTIAAGLRQCSNIYCDQNQKHMSSIFTILHIGILHSQLS